MTYTSSEAMKTRCSIIFDQIEDNLKAMAFCDCGG